MDSLTISSSPLEKKNDPREVLFSYIFQVRQFNGVSIKFESSPAYIESTPLIRASHSRIINLLPGKFMRTVRFCLTLAGLFALTACGGGSEDNLFSNHDSETVLKQSILFQKIEEREDAITFGQAESIKTAVTPVTEEKTDSSLRAETSASDAALLSQFVMYPGHLVSSRILTEGALVSRDHCLQACEGNTRCGGVSYISVIGLCYIHGPTQSIDKLAPVVLPANERAFTFDTYIISSRNQDYNEDGNFYISQQSGNYRIKALYTDGTASAWKTASGGLTGQTIPFKTLEGVIIAASDSDGLPFGFINFYGIKCFGDCSYPQFMFPLIAWSLQGDLQLSTDCDEDVASGCASMIGMYTSIPNQDPPYNEFGTFGGDGEPLSISALASSTKKLVW